MRTFLKSPDVPKIARLTNVFWAIIARYPVFGPTCNEIVTLPPTQNEGGNPLLGQEKSGRGTLRATGCTPSGCSLTLRSERWSVTGLKLAIIAHVSFYPLVLRNGTRKGGGKPALRSQDGWGARVKQPPVTRPGNNGLDRMQHFSLLWLHQPLNDPQRLWPDVMTRDSAGCR